MTIGVSSVEEGNCVISRFLYLVERQELADKAWREKGVNFKNAQIVFPGTREWKRMERKGYTLLVSDQNGFPMEIVCKGRG